MAASVRRAGATCCVRVHFVGSVGDWARPSASDRAQDPRRPRMIRPRLEGVARAFDVNQAASATDPRTVCRRAFVHLPRDGAGQPLENGYLPVTIQRHAERVALVQAAVAVLLVSGAITAGRHTECSPELRAGCRAGICQGRWGNGRRVVLVLAHRPELPLISFVNAAAPKTDKQRNRRGDRAKERSVWHVRSCSLRVTWAGSRRSAHCSGRATPKPRFLASAGAGV